MQKILMVNGSPRKKNTCAVLKGVGEVLKKHGIDFEIVNLSDYNIKHCKGCDVTCIGNNGCNQKDDDMQLLREKVLQSDGVVFSSPVYLSGVTSLFKAFADRTNGWFHNPETAGKPVLLVATTEISGLKETFKYMDSFVTGLGMRKGGAVGRVRKNFGKPVTEKEMAKFLSLLKNDKSKYKPSMNEIVIFTVQKLLAIKMGGTNKQFWQERNWLSAKYYYKCKMNLGKKLFGRLMFKVIGKSILGKKEQIKTAV